MMAWLKGDVNPENCVAAWGALTCEGKKNDALSGIQSNDLIKQSAAVHAKTTVTKSTVCDYRGSDWWSNTLTGTETIKLVRVTGAGPSTSKTRFTFSALPAKWRAVVVTASEFLPTLFICKCVWTRARKSTNGISTTSSLMPNVRAFMQQCLTICP